MKIKELIENLKKCDPEAICVYSRDDEGNGFQEVFFTPSEGLYNEEEHDFESLETTKGNKEDEENYVFEGKNAVCIN